MVSQKVIAEKLNISQSTVSRALKGDPRISADVRAEVERLRDEVGYAPNYMARSLLTNRTKVVSVLRSHYPIHEIQGMWTTAMQMEIRERGYRFRMDNMADYPILASERSADGFIILSDPHSCSQDILMDHESGRIPIVFADCGERETHSNAVFADSRGGIKGMVRYLVGQGHRRLILFGYDVVSGVGRDRFEGYREGLQEHGIPFDWDLVVKSGWSIEPSDSYPFWDVLLEGIRKGATAVVTTHDNAAVGVIHMLLRNGYKVPEDISVTGFDDTLISRAWLPPLTTIGQDVREMARIAVGMIIGIIESGLRWESVGVPCGIRVRGTA